MASEYIIVKENYSISYSKSNSVIIVSIYVPTLSSIKYENRVANKMIGFLPDFYLKSV